MGALGFYHSTRAGSDGHTQFIECRHSWETDKNISWARDLHFWAHSTVPDPAAQRCTLETIKYLAAIERCGLTWFAAAKWGSSSVGHHHRSGTPPEDSQSHRKHTAFIQGCLGERALVLQEVGSSLSQQDEWKSCLFTWGQCPMHVLILYCITSVNRLVLLTVKHSAAWMK